MGDLVAGVAPGFAASVVLVVVVSAGPAAASAGVVAASAGLVAVSAGPVAVVFAVPVAAAVGSAKLAAVVAAFGQATWYSREFSVLSYSPAWEMDPLDGKSFASSVAEICRPCVYRVHGSAREVHIHLELCAVAGKSRPFSEAVVVRISTSWAGRTASWVEAVRIF